MRQNNFNHGVAYSPCWCDVLLYTSFHLKCIFSYKQTWMNVPEHRSHVPTNAKIRPEASDVNVLKAIKK